MKLKDLLNESVNEAVSKTLKYKSRFPAANIFIEIEEDPAGIFVDVRIKGKNYNALLSTTDIEYPSGHINVKPRVKNIPIKESVGVSVNENFTPEQSYNGLFKFKYKGKKFVGKTLRRDGDKYILGLDDIGVLPTIPNVSKNDMEYLGDLSNQGKKGLPYLSGHPKNFKKVEKDEFHQRLVFKGGLTVGLSSYLSKDTLKDINKYYRLKLTKDDLKFESINEGYSTEEKRIVMMAVRKLAKYRNVPLDYAINDLLGAGKELERDIKKGKITK